MEVDGSGSCLSLFLSHQLIISEPYGLLIMQILVKINVMRGSSAVEYYPGERDVNHPVHMDWRKTVRQQLPMIRITSRHGE